MTILISADFGDAKDITMRCAELGRAINLAKTFFSESKFCRRVVVEEDGVVKFEKKRRGKRAQ